MDAKHSAPKDFDFKALKAEIKQLIKTELQAQLKVEIAPLKASIKNLTDRCTEMENSQSFIAKQFDDLTEVTKDTKKHIHDQQGQTKIQECTFMNFKEEVHQLQIDVDEVQQYLRRDCLEIVGIPELTNENPAKIVKEVCSMIDIDLKDHEISTAHRLPDTKSTKNRLIVKFVQRDTKHKIYKSKKNLKGKTTKNIPSFKNNETAKSKPATKIYINESLTFNRKRVLNKANNFKKANDYKYIWTSNGKIYLKENEQEPTYSFTTMDEFSKFESDYD